MTEKYFFGKCGGHNCFYFSSRHFSTSVNLCMKDYEICDTARCKNCPHGKTMEEWAQKLEDNKDFQAIIDDNDASYAEIAEVMIKALLGGGGK